MHNFSLLTLLFFLTFPLSAEVLKNVEIIGNKRTNKSSIIQHGQIKVGVEFSEAEEKLVKENLGRINQVRIKKVHFKEGILTIEIEEKWTLFPVPMITQSGSYHNRGFLIYDDNFLGTLGTFAPGVSWANSIFNYLIYYQDESLFSPTMGIKALVMKRSEFVEFNRNDIVVNQFETRYSSFLIAPNYLYKDQVFKAGPFYIKKTIFNNQGENIIEDKSKGIFFRHHWNNFQTEEVMYKGLVTTFDLYTLKSQTGHWAILNEASANWSEPVEQSFFNFGVHAYHTNIDNLIYAKNIGGEEGVRGYDKASFPISENIGGLIQYQQHLFNRFFLAPFYEYNNSSLTSSVQNGRNISESTIGAGIRYYFKKISIPAVIFDFARNLDDKSNHFHINIGVTI